MPTVATESPHLYCFFLRILPPPRSTLFPYTTLFRSVIGVLTSVMVIGGTLILMNKGLEQYNPVQIPLDIEHPPVGVMIEDRSYTHRSEEHTSELQSRGHLVCRLLLEKKKNKRKKLKKRHICIQ